MRLNLGLTNDAAGQGWADLKLLLATAVSSEDRIKHVCLLLTRLAVVRGKRKRWYYVYWMLDCQTTKIEGGKGCAALPAKWISRGNNAVHIYSLQHGAEVEAMLDTSPLEMTGHECRSEPLDRSGDCLAVAPRHAEAQWAVNC